MNPQIRTQRRRLTDSKIAALKPPAAGYRVVWDGGETRLGVRLSHTGARSFVFDYTAAGRRRRMVLGEWGGDYRIADARAEVSAHKADIKDGADPLAAKRQDRIAVAGRWTMRDLAEDYLTEHAALQKRPKPAREDRAMLDRYVLPRLGDKAVADVTTADIEQIINAIARQGHKPRANRVRAMLSTVFNRAVRKRHLRMDNPVVGVERFREQPRERYLTPDETGTLMKALDEHRNQRIANAIRLLYWTGARRGEVLGATWSEFALDLGIWTKPSAHTKQKRSHLVPLNSAALSLLREIKAKARLDTIYVFPGDDRTQPLKEIKAAWRTIVRRAGIENLRLHDLRHAFASGLLARGVGLEVIGGLLGHTRMETTQRYAHLLTDTLREATERLTQALPSPAAGSGD